MTESRQFPVAVLILALAAMPPAYLDSHIVITESEHIEGAAALLLISHCGDETLEWDLDSTEWTMPM